MTIFSATQRCNIVSRLQNSPYFYVFKYARAVKQKVRYETENRERDCIFTYSSTREQSNNRSGTRLKTESETVFLRIQVRASSQTTGPVRDWKQRARLGRDAKNIFYSLASHALRACEARALRARKHALPISLLILRKKPTVLQSTLFRMITTLFQHCNAVLR